MKFIIKTIEQYSKNPLILGSMWITAGNFFGSLSNYAFNLIMGFLMMPEEYGLYSSLISLTIVISLPSGIISTIATKMSADFIARKETDKLSRLSQKMTEYVFIGGIIIIGLFVLFGSMILSFLNIDSYTLIILSGLIVSIGFIGSLNVGLLRGLLMFKFMAVYGVIASLIKLLFGWFFVSSGMSVFGALLAFFISAIFGTIASYYPLKFYFKEKVLNSMGIRKKVYSLGIPSFSLNAGMMLFLSTDVLLVKHFFTAQQAGIFAAAAIMGKVIYFITSPVVQVFFPVIAQRFAVKGNWFKELLIGLAVIVFTGLVFVILYFAVPQLIQSILFPNNAYEEASSLIGLYSIYMLLFSVVTLLGNFYLARERNGLVNLALLGAFLQIILIVIYHNSLEVVIYNSISVMAILSGIYLFAAIKTRSSLNA